MARYRVKGPDGAIHVFEGPDDATPEQVTAFAQQQFGSAPAAPAAPKEEKTTILQDVGQGLGNLAAGAVRGAGSIGATLKAPFDYAEQGLERLMGAPEREVSINAQRRTDMDGGLQAMGAEPDSLMYGAGKLGGEIAGTAGAGSVLAGGAKAMGAAAPVVSALSSGGLSVGRAAGASAPALMSVAGAKEALLRAAAGAATGGASAGLVNPESAGMGAVVGGVLPLAVKTAGAAGAALRGAGADTAKMAAARAGASSGYVIPPADLQPGIMSQLLSGLSGKIKTSQVASAKNQTVTDGLARKALGLGATDELTPDVLQEIRRQAGNAYGAVRNAGEVTADPTFLTAIDRMTAVSRGAARSFPGLKDNGVEELLGAVRQSKFDAGDAIDATQQLREVADKAFRGGDTALGRAAKGAATELENMLERHLTTAGDPGAVKAFQEARKQIAKSYTVQKAMNPTTGSISAPRLAADLAKGRPLTDELATIAQMSTAFPKATQALKEAPGAVSPLDFLFGGGAGLASVAGGSGGAALAPLAAAVVARPAVRSVLLSQPYQRAALNPGNPAMDEMFSRVGQAGYRALPVISSSRQ